MKHSYWVWIHVIGGSNPHCHCFTNIFCSTRLSSALLASPTPPACPPPSTPSLFVSLFYANRRQIALPRLFSPIKASHKLQLAQIK